MSLKTILQNELIRKGRLYVNDVMEIANRENHYFDTCRRKLEPKDTPFAKKHIVGNRIKWWDYEPSNEPNNGITSSKIAPTEPLSDNLIGYNLKSNTEPKQDNLGFKLSNIRI